MPLEKEPFISNSGYIESPFDPRDVWEDEILAGDVQPPPTPASYKVEGLVFKPQGAWPVCVAASCLTLLEHKLKGRGFDEYLSRLHAFFHGGGTREGAWFRAVLDVLRLQGAQLNEVLPMPENLYDLTSFDALHVKALETPFEPGTGGLGYVRIIPTRERLKQAIVAHGPLLVGVAAKDNAYWDPAHKRVEWPDNHAVLLVGWTEDDHWIVFDSLQPHRGFDGYHTLHSSYTYNSAYAMIKLPAGWRELRDKAREVAPTNANRYGKPRVYQAEVDAGFTMLRQMERFLSKPVVDRYGPRWEAAIRAVVYGGYRITEPHPIFRWRSRPSDILRDAEILMLTGKPLYDFDIPRSQQ